MRRMAALVVVLVLAVPVLWAGELAGVTMEDEVTVGDATLTLNGMGLRKKLWVKVYVAGLYLGTPATNAAEAIGEDGPKRVVMHFLTDKATKKKMDGAWIEGFEANSPATYGQLEERVRKFIDFFGDMKDGDVVEFTLIPGQGTAVDYNGTEVGTIDGDDFADALLLVWLGEKPPSDELKAGLLGG